MYSLGVLDMEEGIQVNLHKTAGLTASRKVSFNARPAQLVRFHSMHDQHELRWLPRLCSVSSSARSL